MWSRLVVIFFAACVVAMAWQPLKRRYSPQWRSVQQRFIEYMKSPAPRVKPVGGAQTSAAETEDLPEAQQTMAQHTVEPEARSSTGIKKAHVDHTTGEDRKQLQHLLNGLN